MPREGDPALLARGSVVYYVRLGDHVKIGYTANLAARLASFYVTTDAVLATEPGSRMLEQQRHAEFAEERTDQRELFNPSPRLLAHIDSLKAASAV